MIAVERSQKVGIDREVTDWARKSILRKTNDYVDPSDTKILAHALTRPKRMISLDPPHTKTNDFVGPIGHQNGSF